MSAIFLQLLVFIIIGLCCGVLSCCESERSEKSTQSGWQWTTVLKSCATIAIVAAFVKAALRKLTQSDNVSSKKERLEENAGNKKCDERNDGKCSSRWQTIKIFFGSQTGTAEKFAGELDAALKNENMDTEVTDLKVFDPEGFLSECRNPKNLYLFVVSTYVDGRPSENAQWFFSWLEDTTQDFRVQKTLLDDVQYAVFGLGNSEYGENFNVVAKKVDGYLKELKARPFIELVCGDEGSESTHGGLEGDFEHWQNQLVQKLKSKKLESDSCLCNGKKEPCVSEEEVMYETSSDEENDDESSDVVDMEDIGTVMKKVKTSNNHVKPNGVLRDMITPKLREELTKQGYKLIGSHSGVKLCRWTKSMLRGRGGCYKHTFYGIASHQCMETTPSLACANKCVFCWRHHSNPVGTEWKWNMDEPEVILQQAMQNHYKMINEFKGVPGVKPERLAEGMRIRHCALSLVGEPIMYPEIQKFITMLHGHGISSFLVTNAQFPDAIRTLSPVTQLYVSVDASTKESLKRIDRPLFKDFWTRFIDSLSALKEKGQRTVYRLTLVKAWNVEEIEGYADLVALGCPDFIEIKGVTYCGTSKGSNLTMENVPWHQEVVRFVQQLTSSLPDYEIASEHVHSNCVLLAHKKFKINGSWWTWINYDKFHELIQEYYASNGKKTFASLDYVTPTPMWAVFGAKEEGFDPAETRWFRKNRKDISGC